MYLKLPENAEYRRVEVTEDGMIGIVYSEECACMAKHKTMMNKGEMPKPKALAGENVTELKK